MDDAPKVQHASAAAAVGAPETARYKQDLSRSIGILGNVPPILALASLVYIFTKQTSLLLNVTLITAGIGLLYWAVVILPQRGKAWNLRHAALDQGAAGDA